MRTVVATLSAFWVLAVTPFGSALAWNDTGHQVVALIAWDHLSDATRQKVVALMAQSTSEPLTALLPQDGRPLAVRQREFFVRASTWADLIRGTADDRPMWHHRSFFWKQVNGQAVDVPDIEVVFIENDDGFGPYGAKSVESPAKPCRPRRSPTP